MKRHTKRRLLTALTYERAHELFRYNAKTGALYRRSDGTRADTATRGEFKYRRVHADGVRYMAHRVIWLMRTRYWPLKGDVDHKDGDGQSDRANRWTNLRDATRTENNHNTAAHRDNRSGYKWVTKLGNGRFRASIQVTLGEHRTARQAHEIAKAFAREHHGLFFNAGLANHV